MTDNDNTFGYQPLRDPRRQPREDRNPLPRTSGGPRRDSRAPRPRMSPSVSLPQGVAVAYLRHVSYGVFIFQQMIERIDGKPQNGDLVAVIDRRGELFGWAFFNGQSRITLRMFTHSQEMPADNAIAQRVARAVDLRRHVLRLDDCSNAYRLVHAEGDGLTGLIADRFGDYVVIELFSIAMFRRIHQIQDAFIDAGLSVKEFVIRADAAVCEQEGFQLGREFNRRPSSTVISENGVKFSVSLGGGHKTGFFCDQRDNRLALSQLTPGKSVLDCCCYSGGFSCYAATRGKAASVTAVDLDEKALETAGENAKLNNARIDFHHADAFTFLRGAVQSGKKWDVIVLDPSKFVRNRLEMESGLRKYSDLNRLAAGAINPGGLLLTCSCSGLVDLPLFTETVGRAIHMAGRNAQFLRTTGAAADHPVMIDAPEGAYLKALWARLD